MALATPDLGFCDVLLAFRAISANFNLGFPNEKWAMYLSLQDQIFATVGHYNIGHWAGIAEAGFPGLGWIAILQKTAFFDIPASEVVSIKVTAFFSGGCTHKRDYSMGWIGILQENNKKKAPLF